MDNNDSLIGELDKNETTKGQFKFTYVLIPVLVSLFIIAYEDFLNNVFIQPFLYILKTNGLITLEKGTNEYVLFLLLLNLILNFASLILIYFVFFKTHLLSKQVQNKQYGLFTTIKAYLGLFALVIAIGFIFTAIKSIYFPNIPSTSPYESIFPTDSTYPLYNLFLVIILVCIFAPILEELTFRRIMIPLLEGSSYVSTSYAVVISASVFAFIHTEADLLDGSIYFAVVHFTSAFILGLGLAGIYVSTRNVKYSIFYHSMNNTFAIAATIITAYFVTDPNNPPLILMYFGLLTLIIILGGTIIVIISLLNLNKIKYPIVNQFKGSLEINKMIGIILLILSIQGIIFIVIPELEDQLFSVLTLNSSLKVVLNLIIYCGIFGFFIAILRKELPMVFAFGKVQNTELPVFVDHKYSYMQNNPSYYYNPTDNPYNNPDNSSMIQKNTNVICPNCNNTIPANAVNFCPFCGKDLSNN